MEKVNVKVFLWEWVWGVWGIGRRLGAVGVVRVLGRGWGCW